jgi:Flp pilus assembly protein TadG
MPANRRRRFGNSTIEFTLVGIPLIFTLISIFEMSRGMWVYHTMAYAIKEGTRYAVVHGAGCGAPNNCQATIGQISTVIQSAGIGLGEGDVTLTFISNSGTTSCGTLTSCLANTTVWPPFPDNIAGLPVEIDANIPFKSALAMFWPGAGKGNGVSFGAIYFPATSQEVMEF